MSLSNDFYLTIGQYVLDSPLAKQLSSGKLPALILILRHLRSIYFYSCERRAGLATEQRNARSLTSTKGNPSFDAYPSHGVSQPPQKRGGGRRALHVSKEFP
jgi:hypothetical protein